MAYMVSAHGGRWSSPVHNIWMPDGFSMKYFVQDQQILLNNVAWPLYQKLRANKTTEVESAVVETVDPGGKTYNYSCWNYPQIGDACGVFQVGGSLILSLSGFTAQNPLTILGLINLLKKQKCAPGVIYWVACQEAS